MTAADRLCLLLARCAPERRARRAELRAAAARAGTAAIVERLGRLGMLPLLGARLVDAEAAPPGFAAAHASTVEQARRWSEALGMIETGSAEALAAAGVPVAVLKGPRLARRAHGDVALRSSSDVDLLVPWTELAAADRVLAALGWRRATGRHDEIHVSYVSDHALPRLDLHWRVHWYEARYAEELLARAQDGEPAWLDDVACALLFHARDGFAGLRHPVDATAVAERHLDCLREGALRELAGRHPALTPALEGAARVVERATGLEAGVLLGRPPSRRAFVATAVGDSLAARSADQMRADAALVDVLLAPAGSGTAARRRYLRPPARLTGGRATRWRVLRSLKLAGRWAWALARALRCAGGGPATR